MKVLHLISGGDVGGAKTHVLTLLKQFNKMEGNKATLVCIMESSFTKDAREMGIDVAVFPQQKRYDISVIFKIAKLINTGGFQILHCHGARANFIALFLRLLIKIPSVTTIHSDYKYDFINSRYKQWFYMPLNAFALSRFQYHIAVTKAMKEMMTSRGFSDRNIFVVYNGLEIKKHTVMEPQKFLEEYGITYDKNKFYIGVAARLHPVKGVDVFLKAANELKHEKNLVFLIAGGGDEKSKYEQFIKENDLQQVFMLGHVKDIHSFYHAIDVNTLSSYTESFTYSLLEGGLMKKPTITSAVGGLVEMIENEKTGLLFSSGDYVAFSKCIMRLVQDETLRNSLAQNFYDTVVHHFSSDKMAQTHLEIYKKIVKE